MKRLWFVLLLLLALFSVDARAQGLDALVVQTCGQLPLAYAPGATRQPTVDINGVTCSSAPAGPLGFAGYPSGATPVTVSVTSAGSFAANLPAVPGKFTYICGFAATSAGATAAGATSLQVSPVASVVSLTYVFPENAIASSPASPVTMIQQNYVPCIPASAVNTVIQVSLGAAAGNLQSIIAAWGFQL